MANKKNKTNKTKAVSKPNDIADSPEDSKHLEPESANLDLPDAKDIPGQKHVHVPKLREAVDTTASSDDEEGKGIFENSEDPEDYANVNAEEKELLQQTSESMASKDDIDLRRGTLDNKDLEGESLNENEDVSGKDLDVPGQEDDDMNEDIGEEDEENNEYSLGDDAQF
ncbi:MAG TPA: hypothetical protein VN958_21885 [Chitinophagaceae bacterium]|nr:hypothetical protein [Chitinophagaceae bacterium]